MAEEHVLLSVGGHELEVVHLDGVERLSELFRLEVVCRGSKAPAAPKELIAADAVVSLRDSFGVVRTVTGIVADGRNEHHDDGSTTTRLTIYPPGVLLTRGSNCRAFLDSSVVDIVTKVLGSVPHRWELSSSYATRAYCVQYRENDWTYINRMLEDEGIYYWFDHAAGSIMVLSDQSTAAPDLDGGATIQFVYESGMSASREMIEQLGAAASVAPGKFSVRSFSPSKPTLDVGGSTGEGSLEIYDAPGGGTDSPDEAARQAQLMSQGSAAARAGVSGQSSSVRITPGRVVEVTDHPLGRLDGRYLVTGARYRFRQRRRGAGSDERPYSLRFTGISEAAPYRPPRDTPRAQQAGLQSARVIGPPGEEIYPHGSGEVRVQMHWDREGSWDDKSGKWMRVAQRGTHDSMLLPRIGWNVLTFNDEGAVDAPSVLARVHDAEHPPAYSLPANKTRVVFKTATSPGGGSFNEIYFEDIKGAEEMYIEASKDMQFLVKHVRSDLVHHDASYRVGNDHSLTVATDHIEVVENNQSVSIGANETIDVGDGLTTAIIGDDTVSIGGSRFVTVGNAAAVSAQENRSVSVGAAIIDTSLGTIGAQSMVVAITVGGANLKLALQGIAEGCGGVSVQTIGGAKLEFAKENRPLDVKKQLVETVGALLIHQTDGGYTDGVAKVSHWTVGAKMSCEAPKVMMEALEKIEFKCGGSSLTITPESVEFKAPNFDLSKASHIEAITPTIDHN